MSLTNAHFAIAHVGLAHRTILTTALVASQTQTSNFLKGILVPTIASLGFLRITIHINAKVAKRLVLHALGHPHFVFLAQHSSIFSIIHAKHNVPQDTQYQRHNHKPHAFSVTKIAKSALGSPLYAQAVQMVWYYPSLIILVSILALLVQLF